MDDKFRFGKGITHEQLAEAMLIRRTCCPEQVGEQLAEAMPIRRTCCPEQVAPDVLFSCSDGASHITGRDLAIDGGFSAR
jgi:3-hydroxybutyrate dehydrogenase